MRQIKRFRTVCVVLLVCLLLAGVARAATLLRDDFQGSSPGWTADDGGGGNMIEWSNSGEYLYLHDTSMHTRFPLVGRNDAFDAFQSLPTPYWRLSLRFRYLQLTGYGVTIASGTAGFNTTRGGGIRTNWENILRVTQRSGGGNFQVGAYGTVHYAGSNSTAWHTVELDVSGSSYVLRLDGSDIGSGTPSGLPESLWFGNYTIQPVGGWSDVQVDWVEVTSDLEAPATTATPSGTSGNAGWWLSDVSVSLAAVDAWSGVAGTSYRIDGGGWTPYSGPFAVAGEGAHTVEYRSSDNAGNVEAVQTLAVNIDPTPPATSATPAGAVGCAGWYTSTVQVTLAASDATSGVALTQYQVNGGGWQAYGSPFALSDGSYTMDYRSTDVAGNQEAASSLSFDIDTSPPATTSSLSGTAGGNSWYRSDVNVTLSSSDATSGLDETLCRFDAGAWQTYAGGFTITGEGMHTLEYYATDVACNTEGMASEPVNIDTVAPSSTIASLSDDDWINGTVSIAGSASDATSGVALVDVSTNGGGSWQTASGTTSWTMSWDTTTVPDGDYDICARGRDVAGNVESVSCITVHVDNTAPASTASTSGTAGCNGWYHSNVGIALSASDGSGIGVSTTSYRVDGGTWQVYSGAFTISGQGAHVVEYYSTDGLGNTEATNSLAVNIDSVPPATAATPTGTLGGGGWYISSVDIALSASDATSGVGVTEYRVDGGTWQAYGGSLTVSSDGAHMVEYRSRDNACNVEAVQSLAVNIDTLAPVTALDLDGIPGNAGWWRSTVTATLSASDATSGVALTEYDLEASGWISYSVPFSISGEGDHDLDYRSTDVAGHQEAAVSAQVRIDSVPPATTASITGTLGLNGWYTDTVTVSLSASDATSGVDATYLDGAAYSAPALYAADGSYSLPYYSTDVAGNAEAAGTEAFGLDATPPVVSVIGGRFCPHCGQILMIQPAASDATSGLSAWRLEILDGATVVISWTGTTAPASIPWNGRDASGDWVDNGTYDLVLLAQDAAGWTALASGQVEVRPKPSSPSPPQPTATPIPSATPTPWPTWTPTPTGSPTPAPTLRPGETPEPTAVPSPVPTETPMPTSTPAPIAEAVPSVVLRVGVFRDDDEDATKIEAEPGLAGLEVHVGSEDGWNAVLLADAQGVVTITLPGPGVYKVSLLTSPREGSWAATTRRVMLVQVEADRSVVILPGKGGDAPVGTAPTCAFAFGLALRAARAATIWLPLAAITLVVLTTLGPVFDRRAKAIRELTRTIGGAS